MTIQRTVEAINYEYRSEPTRIDFRGTVLMPKAKGEALVESKRGRTESTQKSSLAMSTRCFAVAPGRLVPE